MILYPKSSFRPMAFALAILACFPLHTGGVESDTIETHYVYSSGGQLLAEYEDGVCVKEYIYSGGHKLVAEYLPQEDRYLYYTADQIGSTRMVADQAGEVVHSAAYGPYGDVQKIRNGRERVKPGFSGKEREARPGVDYFGARYYDPQLHRFLSVDPVLEQQRPQDHNLYSYSRNSPISFLDPDGARERKTQVNVFLGGLPTHRRPHGFLGALSYSDGRIKTFDQEDFAGLSNSRYSVRVFLYASIEQVKYSLSSENTITLVGTHTITDPNTGDAWGYWFRDGRFSIHDSRIETKNLCVALLGCGSSRIASRLIEDAPLILSVRDEDGNGNSRSYSIYLALYSIAKAITEDKWSAIAARGTAGLRDYINDNNESIDRDSILVEGTMTRHRSWRHDH